MKLSLYKHLETACTSIKTYISGILLDIVAALKEMDEAKADKSLVEEIEKESAFNTLTLGIRSKNLLKLTIESVGMNGIKFDVNSDGTIDLSGTLTANGVKTLGYVSLMKGVSYRLTGTPKDMGLNVNLALYDVINSTYISGAEDTGDGLVYTPEEDITVGVRLVCSTPLVINAPVKFYPMLSYAEISDDSYEPYRTSNLQDHIDKTNSELAIIKSTIGSTVKNLLNVNMVTSGWSDLEFNISNGVVTVSGQNSASIHQSPAVGKIKLTAGDRIRLSGCPDGGDTSSYGLELRSLDKTINYGGVYNNTGLIININQTAEYYVVIRVAPNYSIPGQLEFRPMIQNADIVDTNFEPHQPSIQNQIDDLSEKLRAIPKLKTLEFTGITSANGNIQLKDENITLARANSVIVSSLALSTTSGVATASSLMHSNNNYFLHCFSADKNHTTATSQEMKVLVYYYDLTETSIVSTLLPDSMLYVESVPEEKIARERREVE